MSNIQQIIDSVSEITDISTKIQLLFDKGIALINKEPQLGIALSEYILTESKSVNFEEGEAVGYNLKALCHMSIGNHEQAIRNYTSALGATNSSLNDTLKGNILNNLGTLFNQIGDLEKSLIFYTDAYQIFEKGTDEKALHTIIMNIGIIYLRTKNYNTGVEYLKRAQTYFEKVKDLSNMSLVCNNIGMALYTIERFDECKSQFKKALELAEKINDKTNACRASLYLGLLSLKDLELVHAEKYFHHSMTIAVENDMKVARVFNYKGFARLYAHQKQFNKALDQLMYATEISDQLNLQEEKIEIILLYAEIHRQMGDAETAYDKLLEYKELKEKWMNEENMRKMQQLQISNQIHQITREKELAEQASSAKSNFLSNMSHEIRTPMNAVFGFASLLFDSPNLNEEDRQSVSVIKQSAQNLIHIINEILDFSKIEAGKIEFKLEPFSIDTEIKKIHQMFVLQAKQKNLALSINVSPQTPKILVGDSFRLNQVLINLIGNAMKFTEKGGISISVKPLELMGDGKANIQFQVQDTGIGIEKNKLEQLFERFKQVSAETAVRYGGTGLGLAISKQLVELQDGSMVATSNPGGGTIFTFCVPYTVATEQDLVTKTAKVFQQQEIYHETFRMLVADDTPFNQLIVKRLMTKHFFNATVETVDSGKAALSMLSRFKYDVVLLDVRMPDMDGTEVAERIKASNDEKFKNLPIVAFTAGVTDEERRKVKKAGMDFFLPKPFTKEELFQMFRDVGIVKD